MIMFFFVNCCKPIKLKNMKKFPFFLLTIFICFIGCKNENKQTQTNSEEEVSKLSLLGTWERISYYNYLDGKVSDTFVTTESNRHIKMYTQKKVMWCRNISADSTEWFGFGSYTTNDTLLTEVLDYGSKAMNEFIEKNPKFVFKYQLEKDKFSQIQVDEDGNPLFAENYIRIE